MTMYGVTMQGCYRDQRKIAQVLDQMKMLGNNLDELREEIAALRIGYLNKEKEDFHVPSLKQNKSNKSNILHKVKKYINKVSSACSLRAGQKVNNSQKACYLDPSLSIFLNYMLRMGKKGGLWQTPTKIKCFKCQANQTDEELQRIIANSPTVSMHAQSVGNASHHDKFSARKLTDKRQTKIISPITESSLGEKCSEISCDLDVQIDNPRSPTSTTEINIFPESCIIKNYPQNGGVCLANGKDKQRATKSTQIDVDQYRRRVKNCNSHSKPANFSKIRNSVITKKAVKTNDCSYTICGKINSTKRQQYLKREFCSTCTCMKDENDLVCSRDKDISTVKEEVTVGKKLYETYSNEELPHSSSSNSVHLEVNISGNSVKTEECSDEDSNRRRPRTYLIHKKCEKQNQDNRIRYERCVVYMGQTSDLTLSSSSFYDKNIAST